MANDAGPAGLAADRKPAHLDFVGLLTHRFAGPAWLVNVAFINPRGNPAGNNPQLDLLRVLKMVLIHDLVEIDAGDTFVYDDVKAANKAARENPAAD